MTDEEKLDAILAKCRELLQVAGRRTKGAWTEYSLNAGVGEGGLCFGAFTSAVPLPRQIQMRKVDAAYIVACSVYAERSLQNTEEEIEGLKEIFYGHQESEPMRKYAEIRAKAIIAAWEAAK